MTFGMGDCCCGCSFGGYVAIIICNNNNIVDDPMTVKLNGTTLGSVDMGTNRCATGSPPNCHQDNCPGSWWTDAPASSGITLDLLDYPLGLLGDCCLDGLPSEPAGRFDSSLVKKDEDNTITVTSTGDNCCDNFGVFWAISFNKVLNPDDDTHVWKACYQAYNYGMDTGESSTGTFKFDKSGKWLLAFGPFGPQEAPESMSLRSLSAEALPTKKPCGCQKNGGRRAR